MAMAMISALDAQLQQLDQVVDKIPMEGILIGHSLFVGAITRGPYRDHFLIDYWVSFCTGFGGASLAAILMQNSPAIFVSNMVGLSWTLGWYLMHYCPGDVAYKVYSLKPIQLTCECISSLARTMLICQKTAEAFRKYPGVVIAPLIIGTMIGCGGRLVVDAAMHQLGTPRTTPVELAAPTWLMRSAFLICLFYAAAVEWLGLMSGPACRAFLITLMVMHTIAKDLLGPLMDPTEKLYEIFHTISFIPNPSPPPEPSKPAAKRATKSAVTSSPTSPRVTSPRYVPVDATPSRISARIQARKRT